MFSAAPVEGLLAAQALGLATWDWQERAHKLVWKLKRVQGGADVTLKVKPSVVHLSAIWSCAPTAGRLRSTHLTWIKARAL